MKQETAHGAYQVLVRPHISEKSLARTEEGKYVFEILPRANAHKVKQAIEQTYDVDVEKVNIVKVASKKIRVRARFGKRSRYNKAIVTLKKGNEIEVLPQ